MENPPVWSNLLNKALGKNRRLPYARYFQLSTVREDGKPANRTVVFRGFLSGSSTCMKFVTDTRSEKIEQLKRNNWVEACWYLPETREQFRIQGTVRMILPEEADAELQKERTAQWRAMSDNARSGFAVPHPGIPRDPDGDEASKEEGKAISKDEPLDSFALMLLDPVHVDYLCLKGDPQFRAIHEKLEDGSWSSSEVNA